MNKRITILNIIGTCVDGGIESKWTKYYKCLNHTKFAMDFLFYGKTGDKYVMMLEENNDRVFVIPHYNESPLRGVFEIRKIVLKNKYDIVYSNLNTLSIFPLLGAKLGGAKVRIAENHATANFKYERKRTIIKYIFRPSITWFATDLVAPSKHAGEWAFGRKKFSVIKNAIELRNYDINESERTEIRKKYGWNDSVVLGHIGRLTKTKNHHFLLEIFVEFVKKHRNAQLVIVGEGELESELKQRVNEMGISSLVHFMGFVEDIPRIFSAIDIVLLPSFYEGLGMVAIEAQAAGTYCICSDNVPSETNITDLIKYVSLEDGIQKWINVIEHSLVNKEYRNENTRIKKLKEAGYDIEIEVKRIEQFFKDKKNSEK